MEIFHTIDVLLSIAIRVGQGAGTLSCKFSHFLRVRRNPRVLQLLLGDQLHNQLLDGEKNCIGYHLFCIIFFVVLLNCLYLSSQILLVHSSPHPTEG